MTDRYLFQTGECAGELCLALDDEMSNIRRRIKDRKLIDAQYDLAEVECSYIRQCVSMDGCAADAEIDVAVKIREVQDA